MRFKVYKITAFLIKMFSHCLSLEKYSNFNCHLSFVLHTIIMSGDGNLEHRSQLISRQNNVYRIEWFVFFISYACKCTTRTAIALSTELSVCYQLRAHFSTACCTQVCNCDCVYTYTYGSH